ncbi:YjhX family toxin [Pseudoxanthobacter sp.]|uniref:YjhX family toxin n=1 Tax=Pseudoxanthobacter sp. TaxID=1925742 RepID=UPI002FE38209
MNLSRPEQRILHALAQGGCIVPEHDGNARKPVSADCITREGWHFACPLALFRRLKQRRFIASANGGPYRITQRGLIAVRAQPDNR